MVPVVAVNVAVVALTVLEKVAPPELVMVRVPISVPMAPAAATTPVVLIIRFDAVPLVVPVTASRLMAFAIPVPTVNVALSANVASPKSINPVAAPPMFAVAVTATGVLESPNMIVLAPVVAIIVPAILRALGAVAVSPAVKVVLSLEALPMVNVPVLLKVVVPAMELVVPVMDTLYALPEAAVRDVVAVRLSKKDTVAAAVVFVIATVSALTVFEKVAPPELVMVSVVTPLTEPVTPIVPLAPALRVRAVLLALSLMVLEKLMLLPAPPPLVTVVVAVVVSRSTAPIKPTAPAVLL